jgi:hypothetical protein
VKRKVSATNFKTHAKDKTVDNFCNSGQFCVDYGRTINHSMALTLTRVQNIVKREVVVATTGTR